VKQIRKRLTYANVMSSIAVFLVLGGAAIAATQLPKNSVGTKQLKNNAVTTAKLKANAVTTPKLANDAATGAKVDEASLSQVPSAAKAINADNAANATNATNAQHANSADNLGGVTLRTVSLFDAGSGNLAARTILNLNGLVFVGSCSAGLETVEAETTVPNGEISSIGFDAATEAISFGNQSDDFDPGEQVQLINASAPNNDLYQVAYQGGDGRVVTVQLSTEGPFGTTCGIGGHAIG
jgi:hypothetical protein